ncbi:IS3 family transposase [Brachybacterium sp. EF45031]|nr:IS3 family transposase [Brachybacterium sillae]
MEIAVAEYIDWYNHRRVHGELAQRSPAEVEEAYRTTRDDQPAELTRAR